MLEKKLNKNTVLAGIALALGASGCGTTLQHLDTKTEAWYECKTNNVYPERHPCYQVVQSYLAAQQSSSSSSTYSSSGRSYDGGDRDRGDKDNSKSEKSGKSECPTGGHWEKPR